MAAYSQITGFETVKLPNNIRIALEGSYAESEHRDNRRPEKKFARALIAGEVKSVKLSASYWLERPKDQEGCMLATNSIEVTGGIVLKDRHVLLVILDHLGIRFSGCGESAKGYAQASWSNRSSLPHSDFQSYGFENMDLPLMVCYFNEMKDLLSYAKWWTGKESADCPARQ